MESPFRIHKISFDISALKYKLKHYLSDIDFDEPLFYDGLGLDSIDSLELSMALSGRYGFQLKSDDPNNKEIFSSVRSLAKHVKQNKS